MPVVAMTYLLEGGVHFGHQTKRWNPKMSEYIFSQREGIHIIDLQKTNQKLEEAHAKFKEIAEAGGKFLFVGTKKQAQVPVKEEAMRAGMFYVTERWLGGTLTNFATIRKRVHRMAAIEKMENSGLFDALPKKEVIGLKKEHARLERYFGGIREMDKLPQALFVVDPMIEITAIREARKLNIPVFGLVDTNCDPDVVDYVIPGNDDATRAIKVITAVLVNAIIEVNGGTLIDLVTEPEKPKRPKRDHNAEGKSKPREHRALKAEKAPAKTEETNEEKPKKEEQVKKAAPVAEKKAEAKEEKPAPKKETKEKKVTSPDYELLTVAELKAIAKERGITGFSKLKKDELISVLK